ncbi:hypothetical protein ACFFHJ_39975 [Planotetraspora thailandica]|uniref:hypothetical protein n=1 Tax=Planotetraspora thailandica TaxID=487172 RepID=UPI0035F0DC70
MRRHDIELESLTGPLKGVYDPFGHGAALFAFFAGMVECQPTHGTARSNSQDPMTSERPGLITNV